MEASVEGFRTTFVLASLLDVGICIGVICALGFFLWHKGRETISPKR